MEQYRVSMLYTLRVYSSNLIFFHEWIHFNILDYILLTFNGFLHYKKIQKKNQIGAQQGGNFTALKLFVDK